MEMVAESEFFVVAEESPLFGHAELAVVAENFDKAPFAHGSKGDDFPLFFLICAEDVSFLAIQVFLCERVINVVIVLVLMVRLACL